MTLCPCKLECTRLCQSPAQASALGQADGAVQALQGSPKAGAWLTRTHCKESAPSRAEPPLQTKTVLLICPTRILQLRVGDPGRA